MSPTNEQIDKLNDLILSKFDVQTEIYYTVDTILLTPSGVQPQKLILKIWTSIILMRNLTPPRLCNGTRQQIKKVCKAF